jgi:hypothetical protein
MAMVSCPIPLFQFQADESCFEGMARVLQCAPGLAMLIIGEPGSTTGMPILPVQQLEAGYIPLFQSSGLELLSPSLVVNAVLFKSPSFNLQEGKQQASRSTAESTYRSY